jgi:hypothetical protein
VRSYVAFSSGKAEEVLANQKPRLAVIRTRFRWFVNKSGVTTYYPRAAYVADSGMRGHVQALCGLPGYDFPVVVTLKGTASKAFEQFLREFSQKVQDAAHRLLAQSNPGARFPRFAFYMRLAPGAHQKVGQKGQESIVTPPVLELPEALTADYLGKVYAGREKLLAYQQVYRDSAEWAAAWDKAGAEESHDDGASVDPDTGEIGPRENPHNLSEDDFQAPAKSWEELWSEFCAVHPGLTRAHVVKALKFNSPGAYLKAHPEDTFDGALAKIERAIQAAAPAPAKLPEF